MLPPAGASDISVEHERLIALINSMSDGVIAIDQTQTVVMSNSVALDLLDVNSLSGRNLNEAIHLFDEKDDPVSIEALIGGLNSTFTTRDWHINYGDKSQASLFVSISSVRSGFGAKSGAGWVLILRDITAEKSLEEERNDFISVTSHELRTPIAVTEGNISNALLLADKSGAGSEIRQSLAAAHDQVLFLGNLINDLAMLSRANRGKLALDVQPFDVELVLKELAQDYSDQAQAKGLKIELRLEPALKPLQSSELYIREILQNFITNSLKYTETGSLTLSAKHVAKGVVFGVADTGIGISKSDQNSLFKKFFRSEDWRVKKITGTGLGLYVTAKLIKLINGELKIESELNVGTKIELYIPNIIPTQNS